jgi:hypothetical protein
MLILALALLAQDPAPIRGPFVDLSTGSNRILADQASIRRVGDDATLVVIVTRPDGFSSEHDYRFDCSAGTYTAATWRGLDERGRVTSHNHAQMRPASRRVDAETELYRALACDGDPGDYPVLISPPRAPTAGRRLR